MVPFQAFMFALACLCVCTGFFQGVAAGQCSGSYASVILKDRPWGYWRMNEAFGTTAADCR